MSVSFVIALLALIATTSVNAFSDLNDDDDPFAFLRVPLITFGGDDFGSRPNGEYFGQWAVREADGKKVPHGVGSYLDAKTGTVEYSGRWHDGNY